MGDPKSGAKRRRAVGTRDRVMARLAAGEITDETGMASTVLAAEVGYPGSSIAFAQLLSGMERSGLIERAVRGKRTYRIAIAAGALGVRPAAGPGGAPATLGRARPSAAALAGTEAGRHLTAAADGGGFDYDELARRLLLQVVRQLAADPSQAGPSTAVPRTGGLGTAGLGAADPRANGPGTAGPRPADLGASGPDGPPQPGAAAPPDTPATPDGTPPERTVAHLEQELASVRTLHRHLSAENARLREQLRAARQSLDRAQAPATADPRQAEELTAAEADLLKRLLIPPTAEDQQTGTA